MSEKTTDWTSERVEMPRLRLEPGVSVTECYFAIRPGETLHLAGSLKGYAVIPIDDYWKYARAQRRKRKARNQTVVRFRSPAP